MKRTPQELRAERELKGELDWIVMKALEKERNRRYDSPSAFAADVERFLADEPVQACPPSTLYRLSKTVRRNRGAVLASLAVAVALLLGMATTFWQLSRALSAEAATADALTKVLRQQEVSQSRLEFAEEAVDDMYTQFASKWISKQAGLTSVQREFLAKAVKTYERLAETDDDSQRAGLRTIKALLRVSIISGELGDREKCSRVCMNSIQIAEKLRQNDPMNSQVLLWLAKSQSSMAFIYRESTEVQKLIEVADSAYANLILISPEQFTTSEEKNEWRKCWGDLARLYTKHESRVDKASKAAELTVEIAKSLVEAYPKDADFRYGLAGAYSTQGTQLLWFGEHNQETFEAYQACLELYSKLAEEFPDDRRNGDVIPAFGNTIVVLGRLKRREEIPAVKRKLFAIVEVLAEKFPDIVSYQETLALSLSQSEDEERLQGNIKQADLNLQRAVEILERVIAKFPDRADSKEILLTMFLGRGNRMLDAGETERSLIPFYQMLALARVAVDRHPESAYLRQLLKIAKTRIALSELTLGNHAKASDALVEIELQLGDARDFQKRVNEPGATKLSNFGTKLSMLEIGDRTKVSNLFEYCFEAGQLDASLMPTQREVVLNSYRHRSDFFLAESLAIASAWSTNIVAGEDILGEAVKAVDANGVWAKTYIGPRSLKNTVFSSEMEACGLLANTIATGSISFFGKFVSMKSLGFRTLLFCVRFTRHRFTQWRL